MTGMMTRLTNLKNRFRYSIKDLVVFETNREIGYQKSRTTMILLSGFIMYSLLTIIPAAMRHYYHGVVTNISISIWFLLMFFHLVIRKSHVATVILASYGIDVLFFFHFIMETDWTIGMDAFWLFILITPFITDYLAGAVFGSIAAISGLFLSLICFKTPMVGYLQPYGSNMLSWYTVIYSVVMIAAAVVNLELTAHQIDKSVSDRKIAALLSERNNRLKKLLTIYETNEKTIRKYKHDIRHFNRVLAGFFQNGEYDKAAAYLKDFDSMLEQVTAVSFCDNAVVNELFTIYANQCQKLGFKPRFKALVPARFPMEETDLTSLVANALENAFEAQTHVEKEKRSMQVELTYDGKKLKLLTKNPYGIETSFKENGLPISTREVQSGIGTAQIKAIAEKYGGVASFTQENGMFIVKAIMTCI